MSLQDSNGHGHEHGHVPVPSKGTRRSVRRIPVHVVWLGPIRYVVIQGTGGLAFVKEARK